MVASKKPTRILRRPQVEERTGLRATQTDYLEQIGVFPKRVKIGQRAMGWIESEVEDYIQRKIAESRGQTAA
jgi:prophage regulatory protein